MKMDEKGTFLGFILLREKKWDSAGFFERLRKNWDIVPEDDIDTDGEKTFVFPYKKMMISVSFIPAPVPDGEAETNAKYNYLWKEAAEQTAKHTAQIIVAVTAGDGDIRENARTYVKLCDSCIDDNTVGVYANGVVYQPEFYAEMAQVIKHGELPVFDLVWLGLTNIGNGRVNGYTMGLENFGKYEIEVLECTDTPSKLIDFLISITSYVLEEDATLKDGETIGFSEEQKLKITLSDGVEFKRKTLKLEYPY